MDQEAGNFRRPSSRLVALGNMGEHDMKEKTRRANRRAKVQELALFILEHEPNGCSGFTLAELISRASRFSIDGSMLGMLLKPLVDRGNLRRELDSRGHVLYYFENRP